MPAGEWKRENDIACLPVFQYLVVYVKKGMVGLVLAIQRPLSRA